MGHTKEYVEGYRITRGSDGVLIEVLDYHARPLRLSVSELADLGLRVVESVEPTANSQDEATSDRKPGADPRE